MASLSETYRPKTLDEIVGQAAAVRTVKRVLARGWNGRAFWLTGVSGSGKTTMARIIAEQGAEPWSICEMDAQDLSMEFLRGIEEELRFRAIGGKPGKCWIVNEAHGMRGPILSRLLTLLEIPGFVSHGCVIFTTTTAGEVKLFGGSCDAPPLISRCVEVAMLPADSSARAFAVHARRIALKEGIDGLPIEAYEDCLIACAGNFRRVLSRIESGQIERDFLGT